MALKDKDRARPDEPSAVVSWWLGEFEAFRRREGDFRKEGMRVNSIYAGEMKDATPYNVLFSNTEVMLPSLFSTTPRPVVSRRFKDDDPLGLVAARAGQRMLEHLIDTNIEGHETFAEAAERATMDALLPGRGVTTVYYEADITDPPEGSDSPPVKSSEALWPESQVWNRVYFGHARKWSKVPWIAYEMFIDRKEATRLFGADKARKLRYDGKDSDESKDDERSREDRDKDLGDIKLACVYQIWDRADGRKLRYISPSYPEGYLKEEDDPLGLTGFFNCPRPLQFIAKPHDNTPVAPYLLYENQARELNRLTIRINRIVEAIKARGVYDGALGDNVAKVMEADDNALVPADTPSSMAAEKGFGNAIWFMPIEQLIATLTQLYAAREQCKSVIYEITGIADIIRGSSKASETLGAQQIKEKWGTLRLRRLQREVQRYARDLLRLMLELAATKFSESTWARMTGLPFVTTERRAQLEAIAQAAAASGQPLDPATQQALAAPVWGQVLEILRDDFQRAYRIDIETNSTIEPEAAEDQKNITELMTALGQYLNGVGPLVVQGVMPFGAAQSMLLAIARRFRFGDEIEDEIKAMRPPKPPDDQSGAKAEVEAARMEVEKGRSQLAADAAVAELKARLAAEQAARKAADAAHDIEIRQLKLDTAEALFAEKQRMAEQRIKDTGRQVLDKIAGEQKVRQAGDQASKQERAAARSSDGVLGGQVAELKREVKTISASLNAVLKALDQTLAKTDGAAQVAQALLAPRERKAVRGVDGRIERTIDQAMT